MSQPRSIFGPLFLIGAGVIWLLVRSEYIPASNLWALTYIWPYLIIAAGVGLILRSFWKYSSILMDVLVIGGILLAINFAPNLGWNTPSLPYFAGNDGFYFGPSDPGSGNVVTESREVGDFTTIELDYPARVTVTQGDSASVTIEAEDNILPGLRTRVQNEALKIYYDAEDGKHVNPTRVVKITIVVTELHEVDFDSAGEITISGIQTDELDISLSGAGNLKVNDLDAVKFSVDLSGAGSMTASGKADNFELDLSGFGSFTGKDLQTQTADVNLSGAGSATVWVEDELDATISGAGSVNYFGSPSVSKQINGVGTVSKSGDK
ncbi:MAG: DUF2807 domain-containing protein [Anaerolineales bacterium]|nr:DUF2807 domain-containing protein [Anaerolineales bacterium]